MKLKMKSEGELCGVIELRHDAIILCNAVLGEGK